MQEFFDSDWIEAFARFVEDEKLRATREGQQEGKFCAHSLGERSHFFPGGKAIFDEESACFVGSPIGIEAAGEANQLLDGHVAVERLVFGDVGDAFAQARRFARIRNRATEDRGVAGCRADHSEKHLDRGAFAGTVWTEERGDAVFGDGQVQTIDGEELAVGFRQTAGLNRERVGHFLLDVSGAARSSASNARWISSSRRSSSRSLSIKSRKRRRARCTRSAMERVRRPVFTKAPEPWRNSSRPVCSSSV